MSNQTVSEYNAPRKTMLSRKGYGVINPGTMTDPERRQWLKVISAIKEQPLTQDNFAELFEVQVGYKFTVPMSALFFSWENEDFSQYAVKQGNVLKILLSPTDGLLCGNKLSRHIEFAFRQEDLDKNNNPVSLSLGIIGGGRNRLTAILTVWGLSQMWLRGIDPNQVENLDDLAKTFEEIFSEEDFLNLQVPVQPVLYSLEYILRSNQSRSMSASEKGFIEVQEAGIDPNPLDICRAIINKKFSASKGWGILFSILGQETGLTALSLHQLGSKIYTHLKGSYVKNDKFPFPTTGEHLLKMVTALVDRLPAELQQLNKLHGITNFAKDGVPVLKLNISSYAIGTNYALWLSEDELPQSARPKAARKKRSTNTAPKATKTSASKPKAVATPSTMEDEDIIETDD